MRGTRRLTRTPLMPAAILALALPAVAAAAGAQQNASPENIAAQQNTAAQASPNQHEIEVHGEARAEARGLAAGVQQPGAPASPNQPPPKRPAAPQGPAVAQIPQPGQKVPQPKSPEEAAAYQAFLNEQNPDVRIHQVEDFLLRYPDSEFRESAYQSAMLAYRQKNDVERMLTYGDLTLEQNPANLTALLMLSTTLSELTDRSDPDRDDKLQEGDDYARRALEVIGKMIKPPGFPDDRWAAIRHESESTAHASRGLIALLREDFARAELELKEAANLARVADPVLLYRLGLSYSFQKKYQEALDSFDHAQAAGGVKVADGPDKTRDLVAEAREFVARGLANAVPPPPASPASSNEAPAPSNESPPGGAPSGEAAP